ncbi:hypothetical protein BDR03DRAFT_984882 [Suillus americanus]|nr:hypothetical protein BDR03DRAFT_984882 [Suillus americanus]
MFGPRNGRHNFGHLIEYMVEGMPNLLKDHLRREYEDWDEFVDDVQGVPSVKLKRGHEELDKDRERDADIARLKAHNTQRLSTPTYRVACPTYPAIPARGGFNMRGVPFMRAQLTRAQILEKLAAMPQRVNTEAWIRKYEADVELWHWMHGAEGFPTLEKPYPLCPGTAILGSGECYSCSMVTEPMHVSTQCITQELLRTQESRWQQQVVGLIRRTASPMNRHNYAATPVQHITAITYPQHGTYGGTGTMLVYMVAPQDESGGWSGQDNWVMQEPGYNWVPENYMEPLPMMNQQ